MNLILKALEALLVANEQNYLCDLPDDEDISFPPSGITMGMIRDARKEFDDIKARSR